MATHLKSLSAYDTEKVPDAGHFSFGIVVSEYNKHITFPLLEGGGLFDLKHGQIVVYRLLPYKATLPIGQG